MAPNVIIGRGVRAAPSQPSNQQRVSRGRGMGLVFFPDGKCICTRPHCGILCCMCGYVGWGRVTTSCPQHPQTIFLIDMSQCPQCHAYAMHMAEF